MNRSGTGPLAILGGTFDPVHWGHLLLAETALTQLGLERVIWVPTRQPPHKRGLAYAERRLMVEKAIADHPAFELDSLITDPTRPDYAIDILLNLQTTHPNRQWYWLIGLDAFVTLPRWYRHQELACACDWLVVPRPEPNGVTPQVVPRCQQIAEQLKSESVSIRWQLLPMPLVGISSSLIRHYCRSGQSIRYLVPEAVRIHISTHHLYSP